MPTKGFFILNQERLPSSGAGAIGYCGVGPPRLDDQVRMSLKLTGTLLLPTTLFICSRSNTVRSSLISSSEFFFCSCLEGAGGSFFFLSRKSNMSGELVFRCLKGKCISATVNPAAEFNQNQTNIPPSFGHFTGFICRKRTFIEFTNLCCPLACTLVQQKMA